jgi:hypothetical protein
MPRTGGGPGFVGGGGGGGGSGGGSGDMDVDGPHGGGGGGGGGHMDVDDAADDEEPPDAPWIRFCRANVNSPKVQNASKSSTKLLDTTQRTSKVLVLLRNQWGLLNETQKEPYYLEYDTAAREYKTRHLEYEYMCRTNWMDMDAEYADGEEMEDFPGYVEFMREVRTTFSAKRSGAGGRGGAGGGRGKGRR